MKAVYHRRVVEFYKLSELMVNLNSPLHGKIKVFAESYLEDWHQGGLNNDGQLPELKKFLKYIEDCCFIELLYSVAVEDWIGEVRKSCKGKFVVLEL